MTRLVVGLDVLLRERVVVLGRTLRPAAAVNTQWMNGCTVAACSCTSIPLVAQLLIWSQVAHKQAHGMAFLLHLIEPKPSGKCQG